MEKNKGREKVSPTQKNRRIRRGSCNKNHAFSDSTKRNQDIMQTIININRNKPTNVNMNGIETKRAFCIVIRCYAFNKYEYKFDKWGAFNHKVTCAKWHSLPFFSPGYHSDKTKYSFAKFTICHSRYAFNGNVFLLNSSNKFWTNREKIDTTTLPCV